MNFGGAAVLQGQTATDTTGSQAAAKKKEPSPCVCGGLHIWYRCYYLFKKYHPAGWKENDKIKTNIRKRLSESPGLYAKIKRTNPDTGILDGLVVNSNSSSSEPNFGGNSGAPGNSGGGQKRNYIHVGNAAFKRLGAAGFTAKQQKEMVIYDSGCTDYATPRLDWMTNLVPAHPDDWLGTVGEGHALKITHWGRIELDVIVNGEIQTLGLDGAVYVPDAATTLISTGKLKKKGIIWDMHTNRLNYNDLIVLELIEKHNLFFFHMANPEFDVQCYWQAYATISAAPKTLSTSPAVWHDRLGHVG